MTTNEDDVPVRTQEIHLHVAIRVVIDETTDLAALADEIDGAAGTVDVAGYRFNAEILVDR